MGMILLEPVSVRTFFTGVEVMADPAMDYLNWQAGPALIIADVEMNMWRIEVISLHLEMLVMIFWLVLWNMNSIFQNILHNPSHWLSYFSRWLKPPTSCIWYFWGWFPNPRNSGFCMFLYFLCPSLWSQTPQKGSDKNRVAAGRVRMELESEELEII